MADDTCIEFDDGVAGYGDFMILNNLGLKARRGKITPLLGPNGAVERLWEPGAGRHHAGHEDHA